MANNVTLPAQGTGTNQPLIETIDTTGAGPHREVVSIGSIGKPGSSTDITIGQKTKANSIPVVLASDQDNGGFTPAAGTVSQVTTGGTAVTAFSGPCNGGVITNPANAARQAVTAEAIYVDMVGTPGGTEGAANGTTFALDSGQSFTVPPLAAGVAVKVNAATTGHKFSVVKW